MIVPLAQALYLDLLFRKFCHLELGGDVPEASTLGRFWTQLVEHGLWEKLLSEINRQLEVKNMIDATPIEAAQSGSNSVYGFNKECNCCRLGSQYW